MMQFRILSVIFCMLLSEMQNSQAHAEFSILTTGIPTCRDVSSKFVTEGFRERFLKFADNVFFELGSSMSGDARQKILISDCEIYYTVSLPVPKDSAGSFIIFFFVKNDHLDNGFPKGDFSHYVYLIN